jgi:glycosyltransferase involved in cell wall biosynthesis
MGAPINICLITNYNYSTFIEECIESALSQSHPFDLILVVDDGSTDDSKSLIESISHRNPAVKLIAKDNGGQLSGFNAAVNLIKNDDRVFFLDADDVYPLDYLELILSNLALNPADFTYCKDYLFSSSRSPLITATTNSEIAEIVPTTSALSRAASCWFGGPTSCITVSGSLFHKIFPYPFESYWKSRADDVIVYASSIICSHKLYLPSIHIGYRTHSNNGYLNRTISADEKRRRQAALNQLFYWYGSRYSIYARPSLSETLLEFFALSKDQRRRHAVPHLLKLTYKWLQSQRSAKN